MKKITLLLTLITVLFTLAGCVETEPDDQTFDPDDYGIITEVTISEQLKSSAKLSVSIQDENVTLGHVYATIIDEKGNTVYSIKLTEAEKKDIINKDVVLHYLIQDETYTVKINGYMYQDGNLVVGELGSTTFTTGVWNVSTFTVEQRNFRVGSDIAVFDVWVDLNDYKGKVIYVQIYDNDTLIDEYEMRFLGEDLEMVAKNHVLENVTFNELESNTVYNIFVKVVYRYYDYDNEEYDLQMKTEYLGTFRTGVDLS